MTGADFREAHLRRGDFLGVFAVVRRGDQVLMVQNRRRIRGREVLTWDLPGGQVEPGELLVEALARELREEGNIELVEPPVLHGMFFNGRISGRDHVALFVVRSFRQPSPPVPDREIAAHGFFPPDDLPEGTTAGTRARIAEVLLGAPASDLW